MKKTKEKPQSDTEPVTDRVAESQKDLVAEPGTEPVAEAEEPSDSVEQLQAKVEALEDSLLRARADYQNLQRRSAIQRSEAIRYANADLMKSLLGVLDDFERSLTAAEASDDCRPVIDGVRLVYENLVKALRARGLEPLEALHRPFDPSVHEAMMQQPCEEHPPGTVVTEIAKGYRLWDRVLRPAKVAVSKTVEVEQEGASVQSEREAEEQG